VVLDLKDDQKKVKRLEKDSGGVLRQRGGRGRLDNKREERDV